MITRKQNTVAVWIAISTVLGLALGLIFYYNHIFYQEFLTTSGSYGTLVIPQRPKTKTMLEFDFGRQKRLFEGELESPLNLIEVLKALTPAHRLNLILEDGRITSVAGIVGRWRIYKNGSLLKSALRDLEIVPGDYYSFRLEK